MSAISRILALLATVTHQSFERMPPAERCRCADLLRHVAEMAEPPPATPKFGGLVDRKGSRSDG
jgi:hypothetical protein